MEEFKQLNLGLDLEDFSSDSNDFKYKYTMFKNIKERIDLFEYKNRLLHEKFKEVDYQEFYREIFGYDSLQEKGQLEDLKFNAIVLDYYTDVENKKYPYTGIINNDMQEYEFFAQSDSPSIITNACSYIGRNRLERNARYMYAMIIDLDYVATEQKFLNLLHQFDNVKRVIKPTYLVNSGTGFHLYYVWDKPIPLFKKNREWIRKLQNAIQRQVWNDYTSMKAEDEDVQKLNITQGYRMVGTATKLGAKYRTTAFKLGDTFAFDDFDIFIEKQKVLYKDLQTSKELQIVDPNHITLKKAEKLYPEWYQERIVEKKPKHKWNIKRDLYDWYLRQLHEKQSLEGSRYFRITTLSSMAKKCNVSYEEFVKDANELFEHLNTGNFDTEFTIKDLEDAMEFYNLEYNYNLTRQRLEEKSKISMPQNKRNYQNQKNHLEVARGIRDIRMKQQNKVWDENNGRKSKKKQVEELIAKYPNAGVRELERISGISRPTIIKWKKIIEKEQ